MSHWMTSRQAMKWFLWFSLQCLKHSDDEELNNLVSLLINYKHRNTHRNISIVNSENFACSTAEPTIRISCRESVICGVRSHGGVVNGLNLEPEPLID